jgi:ribosomal protein S18 acetylase RimI-like enzyme
MQMNAASSIPNSVNVRIRRAVPADAEPIAALHIRAWQWAYRGQLPDALLDGLSEQIERRADNWRDMIGRPEQRTWVVDQGGEAVGFAHTCPSRDTDASPSTAEIGAIYLEAEAAGRGIGRLLFAHAVDDLRLRGYDQATLWVLESNERARRFYKAAGWRPDGATKVEPRPGFELHEMRYRVRL